MSEPEIPRLVLGSSSKWRRQVMKDAGYVFQAVSPGIDETSIFEALLAEGCPTLGIALEIAERKADSLLADFAGHDIILIACDQLADFQGQPRGKPKDADEARAFLRSYRGAEVSLISALAVVHAQSGLVTSGTDTAVVRYGDLPDEAIEQAIATGEVMHSCGAVLHEDPAVAPYAAIVQGTADSVAGLPLALFRELYDAHLRHLGLKA